MDEATSVIPATQVAIYRFKTEAFKFIGKYPFVFVHCHIRICDATDSKSRCAQGCLRGERKRRDVITSSETDADKLYPLAQGPLMLADDNAVQDESETATFNGNEIMFCFFFFLGGNYSIREIQVPKDLSTRQV